LEISLSPLHIEEEIIISAVVRDITQRKQTEKALQNSEERFRTLYENNPLMLFTVDAFGKVLSANQFGIDQLGYPKEQLIGGPLIDVFYEEDRSLAQEYLQQCFAEPDKVGSWELRKVRQVNRPGNLGDSFV